MDDAHFDALTRRLSSRRAALSGLLGGVAAILGGASEETSAHNLVPACRKLADPKRRRRCVRHARRHRRRKHSCKPQRKAITCRNRCGRTRNNCKKAVSCTCSAGKTCLVNKGCNRTCSAVFPICPPGCVCGVPLTEAPTTLNCFPSTITSCLQAPTPCVTSANCPRGFFCGIVDCDGSAQGRCLPNCPF